MSDAQTISVYERSVADYVALTPGTGGAPLEAFVARLPDGGRVLDWGCGPGHDAARFASRGLVVDAVDATPAMVAHAVTEHGVTARVATFAELDAVDAYDGIWASFSLLHAGRDDVPGHLAAARTALRSGGVLYLAVKVGGGERRDALGRRYTYFGETELAERLGAAGFVIEATFGGVSRGLSGEDARWTGLLTVRDEHGRHASRASA